MIGPSSFQAATSEVISLCSALSFWICRFSCSFWIFSCWYRWYSSSFCFRRYSSMSPSSFRSRRLPCEDGELNGDHPCLDFVVAWPFWNMLYVSFACEGCPLRVSPSPFPSSFAFLLRRLFKPDERWIAAFSFFRSLSSFQQEEGKKRRVKPRCYKIINRFKILYQLQQSIFANCCVNLPLADLSQLKYSMRIGLNLHKHAPWITSPVTSSSSFALSSPHSLSSSLSLSFAAVNLVGTCYILILINRWMRKIRREYHVLDFR